MPLPLTVGLIALGVIAIVGAVGYLIDKSVERHERDEDHQISNPDSQQR